MTCQYCDTKAVHTREDTHKHFICLSHRNTHTHNTHTAARGVRQRHDMGQNTHSHGHAKLLQPFLLQLLGFEEQLEATLPLVVCQVEPIGPLKQETKREMRE